MRECLCLIGPEREELRRARLWLAECEARRVVLVGENAEELLAMRAEFPSDAQVESHCIDSLLQGELVARQIAWGALLQKLWVKGTGPLSQKIQEVHRAANLLLADSADFGLSQLRHRLRRGERKMRNGLFLQGAFRDVPAIIVGAGPSLQKTAKLLPQFQDKALIFSGGSGLGAFPGEPHFAAHLDPLTPSASVRRYPFEETPFCVQSRVHADIFSGMHGEAVLFPDSHLSFLNWLDGFEESFESGWVVGTFLAKIASFMGCDPIILVGLDLCYEGGRKYPHLPNTPMNAASLEMEEGKLTQSDWLMARNWLEALSRESSCRWIDAREGGLPLSDAFERRSLRELELPKREVLRQEVMAKVYLLPFLPDPQERLVEWRKSLERCQEKIGRQEELGGEVAYEELLAPLWCIWGPLMEREGGELTLHRLLFFERVIQEHLHV